MLSDSRNMVKPNIALRRSSLARPPSIGSKRFSQVGINRCNRLKRIGLFIILELQFLPTPLSKLGNKVCDRSSSACVNLYYHETVFLALHSKSLCIAQINQLVQAPDIIYSSFFQTSFYAKTCILLRKKSPN